MHPLLRPRHNRRSIALVTAPATEPVTVAEAKTFLRIDGSDDDALLTALIKSARRMAETYTRRSFITQTVRLTMDGFGDADECLPPQGVYLAPPVHVVDGLRAIQLPRLPVQSITSITVFDPANATSTVAPAVYGLDIAGGRLVLNEGQSWPDDLREYAAVEIDFVAGYGVAAAVPDDIRQAILHIVAAMYESRQCADVPCGAKLMLEPYRLPEAYGLW